jgi:hypothetical protein
MRQGKRCISADIEALDKLKKKIDEASDLVDKMINDGKYAEVLEQEALLMQLKSDFERHSYLENISFDVIAREYHEALLRDNERALTGFSTDHRDMYVKLKFKAFMGIDNQVILAPKE